MAVIVVLASYLLGSVSFSVLIARWRGGIDIRAHGSGNAGATNTLRVLGPGPAVAVFALDALKGVAAVAAALWLAPDRPWIHMAAGLAAVAGHNWPLWFRFRGGKGIATTIGIVATLMFLPGLAAGAVGILAIALTRYVSLGSLLFTGLLPVAAWLFDKPPAYIWGSLAIAVFAWFRHRGNVAKLLKGEENKLGAGRAAGAAKPAGGGAAHAPQPSERPAGAAHPGQAERRQVAGKRAEPAPSRDAAEREPAALAAEIAGPGKPVHGADPEQAAKGDIQP